MTSSRADLWKQLMSLSPLCTGSLHEQYLPCGKAACRCHDPNNPRRHGPYYLWRRWIDGEQVNRTLRPGPDLERVKAGIANYRKFQKLLSQLLADEEEHVLAEERGLRLEGKKNSSRRWRRPSTSS